MAKQHYISIKNLCSHYDIEISFVESLYRMGLVEIHLVQQDKCIHQDQLGELEKMIRLYTELNINLEGIDVILNLLEKERHLRAELNALRNRLRLYENN